MKRLRAFLPLLVLIAIGIAVLASGALGHFDPRHLAQDEVAWRASVIAHPWLAALAQVGALALAIATAVPGAIVIVIAGGMLFGVWLGTLLSTIGALCGATLLFFASRRAFERGGGTEPALVARLRHGYLAHPASYTLFLRLVPLFPFGATSVALAWLRCPLWLFLAASAFGASVMIAFESALGAGLVETFARGEHASLSVFAHPQILWPLLGMALLALLPIAFGRLRRH